MINTSDIYKQRQKLEKIEEYTAEQYEKYGNYKFLYETNAYLLFEKLLSVFKYENVPDTLDTRFFNLNLTKTGTCGLVNHENKLIFVSGGYTGKIGDYLIPLEYTYYNPNFSGTGVIDKDVYVCRSNKLAFPMYKIVQKYAHALSQADLSILVGLENTRMIDIIKCTDDSMLEQINAIIKANRVGKSKALAIDDPLFDGVDMLKYSPSRSVGELVDILQVRDNIVAQFCYEIGIGMTQKIKKAQTNTQEMHGYENYSQITVQSELSEQKEFFEKVNNEFGTDIKVTFAEWVDDDKVEDKGGVNDDI